SSRVGDAPTTRSGPTPQWIQATSTRGVRARIRRVAGCATPTGSAGHAGATANLKLTFHLDHSAGADQSRRRKPRPSAAIQREVGRGLGRTLSRVLGRASIRANTLGAVNVPDGTSGTKAHAYWLVEQQTSPLACRRSLASTALRRSMGSWRRSSPFSSIRSKA